ncbi:hypothetical protein J6590_106774 [Homalodisca vitripennis]|nr:hypothetical protein J6590_106774 [Homalodisca vitripennis]
MSIHREDFLTASKHFPTNNLKHNPYSIQRKSYATITKQTAFYSQPPSITGSDHSLLLSSNRFLGLSDIIEPSNTTLDKPINTKPRFVKPKENLSEKSYSRTSSSSIDNISYQPANKNPKIERSTPANSGH